MIEIRDNTDDLIAYVVKRDELKTGRLDYSPASESLQVSSIASGAKSFAEHKHLFRERPPARTQECWIVIRGVVEFTVRDDNKNLLKVLICRTGDCMVTFRGYHGYKMMKPNTIVYEVKTGPYVGRELDKVCL